MVTYEKIPVEPSNVLLVLFAIVAILFVLTF